MQRSSKIRSMTLNDMLRLQNIDPATVLVMRHSPPEPQLRKLLPWLAAGQSPLFDAYQQTQSSLRAERALQRAKFVASFIGNEPTRAVFVGLYRRGASEPLSYDEYWSKREYIEMRDSLGLRGFQRNRNTILWFNLKRTKFYTDCIGKLVVRWPGRERSWWRWADQNHFDIKAILEQNVLTSEPKDWRELTFSAAELKILPYNLKTELREWRGVYFILDESDGRGYVGSACGRENIFGRWMNYTSSGHGGNAGLKNRDHSNFRFSILERVPLELSAEAVRRIEEGWKVRLHTRRFGLNKN